MQCSFPFLSWHILSVYVISLLKNHQFSLLLSIYPSSSLVLFKNGPKYFTIGTSQVFIPWMRIIPDSFSIWQFYSLRYIICSIFIKGMARFYMPYSSRYSSCIFLLFLIDSPVFFFIFWKQLGILHIYKVINLFLWFSKFVASNTFPKYEIEWHHWY